MQMQPAQHICITRWIVLSVPWLAADCLKMKAMTCSQLNALRQQSKLSKEAASEGAAEAAKLQEHNQGLSQQLQELKQKSTSAQQRAGEESHLLQAEVRQGLGIRAVTVYSEVCCCNVNSGVVSNKPGIQNSMHSKAQYDRELL